MTRGKRRRVEPSDPKIAALQATRTLNRDPQAVVDPLFRDNAFFDPRDGLQVRYELVRRHRLEGTSMSTAARLFGVSLPTAYQTDANFSAAGFAGLLPKRRGPKHGHKLTPQTLTHLERQLRERPDWGIGELLSDLQQTFGLTIHRRSLERVLRGKKTSPLLIGADSFAKAADYERLRAQALSGLRAQHAAATLLRGGLAAWSSGAAAVTVTVPPDSGADQAWLYRSANQKEEERQITSYFSDTTLGRQCRDTFISLKKTCRKLGVSFWDYLNDRIAQADRIPFLPAIRICSS